MEESAMELEAKISTTMRARLSDFMDQADHLTLEGVRRVVEKDLGLKPFTLDEHKKFVKQWMEKYFYGSPEEEVTLSAKANNVDAVESETGNKKRKHVSISSPGLVNDDNKTDDAVETMNKEIKTSQGAEITEEKIKMAFQKRSEYIRENAETITMSGLRRLLEEDLKLARNSLDTYKSLIKEQLDECLFAEVEQSNGAKRSKTKKSAIQKEKAIPSKVTKKKEIDRSSEEFSKGESSSSSEDFEDDDASQRKKDPHDLKGKAKPLKIQKTSKKENKLSDTRNRKPEKTKGEESTDKEDESNASDDNHSGASTGERSKKSREKPAPIYGKKVEHLKTVIKSCGMSVPPSIYKRAKEAPENKREAILVKELGGILEREGLSTNPSEKEIKALKRRKEKAKELEGIDTSNIVSNSRRRSASSYIPPKPPQISSESEEDDDDDDGEGDSDDEKTDSGVSSEESEDVDEESD